MEAVIVDFLKGVYISNELIMVKWSEVVPDATYVLAD